MSPFNESAPEIELPVTLESFSETREVPESRFIELAGILTHKGLELVKERFGDQENPKDHYHYHNQAHSEKAISRGESILKTARIGGMVIADTDIALTRLIIARHDTVQEYRQKTDWPEGSDDAKYGRIFRARFIGANEQASIVEIWQEMQRVNQEEGKTVFTRSDAQIAQEAIRGTVPVWSLEQKTVIQPTITSESSLVARAATLADLSEAGMTTESFTASGNYLFLEENLDMHGLDVAALSDEEKTYYKKRMVKWLKDQIDFAKGRKAMLAQETAGLPETVRTLFDYFGRSIAFSQARADIAEEQSFEELYREMGF